MESEIVESVIITTEKKCRKCLVILTEENWYMSSKNRHQNICKECLKIYNSKSKKKTDKKIQEIKIRFCMDCNVELCDDNWFKANKNRKFYLCKKCTSIRKAIIDLKIKKELFDMLGSKCVCCGIDDLCILSLDHKFGGGVKDREKLKINGGNAFYRYVLRNIHLLDNFQILCHNCNICLGNYKYCAHNGSKNRELKADSKYNKDQCKFCGDDITNITTKNGRKINIKICKQCQSKRVCNSNFLKKKQVVESYGGSCNMCGEITIEFLAIDHIFDDGYEERKANKNFSSIGIYQWLLKNNCPKDRYQLLCHNCNWRKQYNKVSIIVKYGLDNE